MSRASALPTLGRAAAGAFPAPCSMELRVVSQQRRRNRAEVQGNLYDPQVFKDSATLVTPNITALEVKQAGQVIRWEPSTLWLPGACQVLGLQCDRVTWGAPTVGAGSCAHSCFHLMRQVLR